jgi:polysaccharide pyruvyl transferase WcaK-like protein
MKILLCGIPLGRNNVGDEAILAGVVKILRELAPGAALTVSTDDPATAARLDVVVCPLFGFDVVPYDSREMEEVIRGHDVVVWAGATGLSDYPELPCAMLRLAQQAGRRTVVWNVGMNSEMNPAKYRLHGRRRRILAALSRLSLGAFDLVAAAEGKLRARAAEAIRATLTDCDLVVTRDPQSREEVLRCGVTREVVVGADSALVLAPAPQDEVPRDDDLLRVLAADGPAVGVCISAQQNIRDTEALVGYLNGLFASGCRVVFLPMNPLTDAALMADLRQRLGQPDRCGLAGGRLEPEHILALAAQMDVIVASRLHLLILASICHVPILGISRGSKVDNFLAPFGIQASGNVETCDFAALRRDTDYWIAHRAEFTARSTAVRQSLLDRLDGARRRLAEVLGR